jgi:hypothetical protein
MGREYLGRTKCLDNGHPWVVSPTCVGTLRNTCVMLRGLLFSLSIETCMIFKDVCRIRPTATKGSRGHQADTQRRWWWYVEEKECSLLTVVFITGSPVSRSLLHAAFSRLRLSHPGRIMISLALPMHSTLHSTQDSTSTATWQYDVDRSQA